MFFKPKSARSRRIERAAPPPEPSTSAPVDVQPPTPAEPPERPTVQITGADYTHGGVRLPLASPRGPRPRPLALCASALPIEGLFYGEFGPDFAGVEAHLHTIEEGYVVIGSGWDGAVLNRDGRLLLETGAFTQHAVMEPRVYPFDLPERLRPEVLRDCAVGFDAAYWNFYHWLIHGLGRSWLTAQAAPEATLLFPDWSHAPDSPPRVPRQVLDDSLAAVFGESPERLRRLQPGVYRVENLKFLWTFPIPPTNVAELSPLLQMFDAIRSRVAARPGTARRRLYVARDTAADPRLAPEDRPALDALLQRHGFERLALETMSFADQVAAASEADIIMGPHGAGLAHLVFSPRESLVIELQRRIGGEGHLRPWFYQLAGVRGQRYAAIDTERPGWVADLDGALSSLLR